MGSILALCHTLAQASTIFGEHGHLFLHITRGGSTKGEDSWEETRLLLRRHHYAERQEGLRHLPRREGGGAVLSDDEDGISF